MQSFHCELAKPIPPQPTPTARQCHEGKWGGKWWLVAVCPVLGVGAHEIFYLVVLATVATMMLFIMRIRPHIHKPEWN